MKIKWIEKGYCGSGSYHGNFTCENPDCPSEKTPSKSKMWFVMWEPEAFENRFATTHGYCDKKCAMMIAEKEK